MKLAYVGNFDPEWSTENDVRKAFEHLGHEVVKLQENRTSWQRVREAAFNSDLLLWTATWDEAQPLKETIDTLRQCAMRGIPTATLHLDIFFGSDRGERKWWLSPMFFTGYVFTADGSHQEDWKRMGVNHFWLKPGVRHDAAHFGKYRDSYACDVAFVGSNGQGYHVGAWPYRKQLVDELRAMCKRNGWTFKNPGGDDPKIERGEDMNDFYASAKVTVGDSLCLDKEQSLYWSDRLPEATARGGVLIMPWIDEIKKIYPDMLMYEWDNFKDLEGKIFRLLDDDVERVKIAKSCQLISAASHTYVNRVQEILKMIKDKG